MGFIAHFHHDVLMFLFYLEIVNKIRQASNTISEITHSIEKPCGRCYIKFIWQFTALNFQILLNLYWKVWKTVVQACKMLKSLSKRPWGSSNTSISEHEFLGDFWNCLLVFCLQPRNYAVYALCDVNAAYAYKGCE